MTWKRASSFCSILILFIGGLLLWRGLGSSRPPLSLRSSNAADPADSAPKDSSSFYIDSVVLSDPVSADSLSGVLDAIAGRVLNECEGLDLDMHRSNSLARDVRELFEYVLQGSREKWVAFYESRGGVPVGPEKDPERVSSANAFSERMLGAFRYQPVSLDQIIVRRRDDLHPAQPLAPEESQGFMRGRYPDLSGVVEQHEDGSYVVVGETYEIVLPIRQEYDGRVSTVLLGVWMTWVPKVSRWLPTKISTYGHDSFLLTPPL